MVDDILMDIFNSRYSIFFIFEETARCIGIKKNEAFDSILELFRLTKKPVIVIWSENIDSKDEERIKMLLKNLNVVYEFKTAVNPQALFEVGLKIKSFISAREMPA